MNVLKKMLILGASLTLAACASQKQVGEDVEEMMAGPEKPPVKTITNFSDGLRCMDMLMIQYGVQDIAILVEDLEDRTSKVNAGTKDMMISAVSGMTRRSRAIKLVAFGNDSGNLISFHAQAGSLIPYSEIPQYDIRGSISQLDSNVARRQEDGGISTEDFGIGPSRSSSGSVLGLDLSVLDARDMSVIPGVVSSNSVVIFKSGAGVFAEATIEKTGLFYSFSVDRNEGTVQALRNLVELATIELIGRLVKVPYWGCVGIPADEPEIQHEIEDWYYAMRAHGELDQYMTAQLRNRGFYSDWDGGSDLRGAVARFQDSKGIPVTGTVDLALFKVLLGAQVEAQVAVSGEPSSPMTGDAASSTAPESTSAQAVAASAAPAPEVVLVTADGKDVYGPGEIVQLSVDVSVGAYLYCYFEDEESNIQRFFPNRFQQDNFVEAEARLNLPGEMPFDMVAASSGNSETVACFASRENLYHRLPAELKSYDFENLEVASLSDLGEAFRQAGNGDVGEARFIITTR